MNTLKTVVLFLLRTSVLGVDLALHCVVGTCMYVSENWMVPLYEALRDHGRAEPGGDFIEIEDFMAETNDDDADEADEAGGGSLAFDSGADEDGADGEDNVADEDGADEAGGGGNLADGDAAAAGDSGDVFGAVGAVDADVLEAP